MEMRTVAIIGAGILGLTVAAADVVVNASLKEGAVTVSFDSMAMGKPLNNTSEQREESLISLKETKNSLPLLVLPLQEGELKNTTKKLLLCRGAVTK